MQDFSKIIITGADGWLGIGLISRLIKEIQKSDNQFNTSEIVTFVQDKSHEKRFKNLGLKVIVGDLKNSKDIKILLDNSEDALVFNLAGLIHPNIFSQKDFFKVNHLAMEYFAEKCSEIGVKKFIAMSSNSPCGFSKNIRTKFDENTKYSPYMGYGHSKMKMEESILSITKNSNKTNFSIVRSPWFYGPHQPPRQTEFFSLIKNGNFPLIGGGESMRSMAYIDNLVDGLILVSQYFDKNGEIFWISDKNPYSMKKVVTTVLQLKLY